MMEVRNKYVVTKSHIDGVPNESDFSICEELLSLKLHSHASNNVVIVKNLYMSIDPYQINRMKTYSSSQKTVPAASAVLPGQAIEAGGVGRVVESWHPDFKTGDFVSGLLHWGEYSVVEGGQQLQKLDTTMGFPLSYYAGGVLGNTSSTCLELTRLQPMNVDDMDNKLGSSGITAYGGFFQVCKPKKGEKDFVSAASGSVGILVGQYAKLSGCYVVGCAGTKEKKINIFGKRIDIFMLFARGLVKKKDGSSGITAYGGFFQVCKPKKGEKVFVSAASGSVGILVGQYAKLSGCYVVGCAGTKEKQFTDDIKDEPTMKHKQVSFGKAMNTSMVSLALHQKSDWPLLDRNQQLIDRLQSKIEQS
ncbi:hypothetical protein DH2020_019294 [Rehmannia glutinosa]|uniref:Oxidoreductase N-terminal domain-containing protein n=1 Tax=Rehmannia glutinosa TaxID=99300 RepID=A0ABR0WLH4_REHGL